MVDRRVNLFYGENTVALREHLKAWTDRFAMAGDTFFDAEEIDAEERDWESVRRSLQIVPLLASKRLVIIRHLFSAGKTMCDAMAEFLPRIPESTVLVLTAEGELDERSPLFQEITTHYRAKHFPALSPFMVRQAIERMAKQRDVGIEPGAIALFQERCGTNGEVLLREMDKLALYASDGVITRSDVRLLVTEPLESRIFNLVDAVYAGNSKEAAPLMVRELEHGTPPLQIIGLFISRVRTLLIISDALRLKRDPRELTAIKKLSPFVYSKLKKYTDRYTFLELTRYYGQLVRADWQIKLGAPTEATMLSLLCIVPDSQ